MATKKKAKAAAKKSAAKVAKKVVKFKPKKVRGESITATVCPGRAQDLGAKPASRSRA